MKKMHGGTSSGGSTPGEETQEIRRLSAALAERTEALEEALAELKGANSALESFGFTISHDLRTPLATISLYAQGVLKHCGRHLDEQCRSYLESIPAQADRMNDIIRTMHDFAATVSKEVYRREVDVTAMARTIAADLALSRPERRVTFHIRDGMTAHADRYLLQVVLANLIGNAWKFTAGREEGVIEVGMLERGEGDIFFVRDNGIGFDPADAERIFEPFLRLNDSKKYEGYGIGLATARRIVRRHGGMIRAEGKPGEGATIFFSVG